MKSNRALLTAVVVIIVVAAGWWMFRRGGAEQIDLLTQFDSAKKQGGEFTVIDATLAGETKRAIVAPPNGRLTFHVRVPDDGWLKVSLGMKPPYSQDRASRYAPASMKGRSRFCSTSSRDGSSS